MSILPNHPTGFSIIPVYARREPHSLQYLSERVTFWIALLSVFAFVTGNMFGQHGWHVFWKSVLGESAEATIVFDGTVPPISQVPDYEKWSRFGGDMTQNTFRQVPQDLLIPLPTYRDLAANPKLQRYYSVDNMGAYDDGLSHGSHPGMDIAVPEGTPVHSMAAGIVLKAANDPQGYGNYVMIKHPRVPDPDNKGKITNLYSIYAHLSAMTVREGDIVRKGEVVGASGQTGFASGPHLHFQVDRDEAPWHPYWPFTGTEAREAGLSMSQAVNKGLHRERGLQYTVNPMLFVQAYSSGAPVQVAAVTSSSSSKSSVKRLTAADRRQARLLKRGVVAIATVTLAAADLQQTASSSSSSAQASSQESSAASSAEVHAAAPVSAAYGATVAAIDFRHEESFGKERGWMKVELRLLDGNGQLITSPSFERPLTLRAAYGKAEFRPATLKATDFLNGKAKIEMLPLSDSTIVIQALPVTTLSQPIRFVR